jgi:hypothetical protein
MTAEHAQQEEERASEPIWKQYTDKGMKGPKMVKPAYFTGRMDETESFVNSCTMYILGQANNFPTDRSTIMWVLSYMQGGSALEWR